MIYKHLIILLLASCGMPSTKSYAIESNRNSIRQSNEELTSSLMIGSTIDMCTTPNLPNHKQSEEYNSIVIPSGQNLSAITNFLVCPDTRMNKACYLKHVLLDKVVLSSIVKSRIISVLDQCSPCIWSCAVFRYKKPNIYLNLFTEKIL